jgi:anaerobic selenocysteine-containing dehydrogenase
MVARSWQPRDWFAGVDDRDDDRRGITEGKVMWVYSKSTNTKGISYLVGYFDPQGAWHQESEWDRREDAAARVNYLNGGQGGPQSRDR